MNIAGNLPDGMAQSELHLTPQQEADEATAERTYGQLLDAQQKLALARTACEAADEAIQEFSDEGGLAHEVASLRADYQDLPNY